MANSLTLLYNQALEKIGVTNQISLPTESSTEAQTCALWYSTVRQGVLTSAYWEEAKKTRRLSTLAEKDQSVQWDLGDPEAGWLYAYALPNDYLRARKLTTGGIFEIGTYTDASNTSKNCLNTNEPNPVLIYTMDIDDIARWGAGLYSAILYALAAAICFPLTRKGNTARNLAQEAELRIATVRAQYENSNNQETETVAPWLAARGTAYTNRAVTDYIYPLTQFTPNIGTVNV